MKKKIAIFNDFQKPLPAVEGGSVPTLINFLIDENENTNEYQFDVYSCWDLRAKEESTKYKNTRFIYCKDARRTRFFTNLKFVLNDKFHTFFDLSQINTPKSARKYFEKQVYDVVFVNGYIRGVLPITRISKAPVIFQHHVVTDFLWDKSIRGKEILQECKRCLFVSEFAAKFTQGLSKEEQNKIAVFKNAIDTSRFKKDNSIEIRNRIRYKHGIEENDKVILFVGRMVANKGALELIKAFNLCDFDSHVKLVIVGGETYSSNKVTVYVRKCLDEAQKNNNIILTGYISYSNVSDYYMASDVATLLSRYDEACGLVGIEAMSTGLPIITTNRGGIGEYVPTACKMIVPDDEDIIENTAQALKKLIDNDELRVQMGLEGIQQAKIFDKVEYFKRFREIINEVI